MKTFLIFAIALVIFLPSIAQDQPKLEDVSGTWHIDKSKSDLTFAIENFFLGTVKGVFSELQGEIQIAKDLENSKVTLKITAAQLESGIEKRDEHLKNEEFFHVEKYPYIYYNGIGIEPNDDKKNPYLLKGKLKIKDVEKPIEVAFNHALSSDKSFLVFVGKTKINRTDFKLDIWDGMGVGETATITFKVVARKKAS